MINWAGIDSDRVFIIPNALDLDDFDERRTRAPQRTMSGKPLLLTLGRMEALEKGKGFDETLEALPALISEFAINHQAFFKQLARQLVIALILRQRRRAFQRLCARRRWLTVGQGKHAGQPFAPLTQMTAHQPEPPQRSGQQDSILRVAILRYQLQHGAEIIVLQFQTIEP